MSSVSEVVLEHDTTIADVVKQLALATISGVEAEENYGAENGIIKPNPADNEAMVQFNMENPEKVHIVLYDIMGTSVYDANVQGNVGINTIQLSTKNIGSGTYKLCIKTSAKSITIPLVIVH